MGNIAKGLLVGLVIVSSLGLILNYFLQKPEIVSRSEEVYWGKVGASPTISLYGISRLVVKSGKACSCELTIRWYLDGELVAMKGVTFSLNVGQERMMVNVNVILMVDMNLPSLS